VGVLCQIQKQENLRGFLRQHVGALKIEELLGLSSDKEALSAAFEAGAGDNKVNLLFGSRSIV
jgi:hypothetical protein